MRQPEGVGPSCSLELVSIRLAGQPFGIPVHCVQEVLGPQPITKVPLAPQAVAGALNLRGRIVTVLDLRVALGFAAKADPTRAMNVVISHDKEVYALLADEVGDMITLGSDAIEPPPHTLAADWRAIATGIVRLEGALLLMLKPERLLLQVSAAPG